MEKLLCVFCASSRDLDPKYYAVAEELGHQMVQRGWGLVYGGGNAGLMGSVARSVTASGGYVVGVIPEFMKERELAYTAAQELITVTTMRERKRIMDERATAFLTLPGGIGTLEELLEIITLRYIAVMDKPVVLLNQDGFYDDLLRLFDRMTLERFKSAGLHKVLSVADVLEDVWPFLDTPEGFESDAIWRAKE